MSDLLRFVLLSVPLVGAYAMFALGISAIFRASRVLNLAHGAMAMAPAYVFYSLVEYAGLNRYVALVVAVGSGGLLGVVVEWLFVRRLRAQGPTAQTVGTVAVTGLLVAVVAKIFGSASVTTPDIFPDRVLRVADTAISYGNLGLFAVGLISSAATFAFFRFTDYGLAMRGAAQNRAAARLMGIDPDRAASAAWAIGGVLAALAGILLAAVTVLDPYTLALQVLPAFVAALIGGIESLVGAMMGAVVVGLVFAVLPLIEALPIIGRVVSGPGATQMVLTVIVLVVMVFRGRRIAGVEEAGVGFAGGQTFKRFEPSRYTNRLIAGLVVLAVFPWVMQTSILGSSLKAMQFALMAVSLVILIGWVGQISLSQATFVGLGAFVTALAGREFGLGFPATLVVGAGAGVAAATLLGVVALRVRGLYLAVATLIFAWMGQEYLFRASWLGVSGGSSLLPVQTIGTPGSIPSFDLTSRRVLYYVILAVLGTTLIAAANLRDTRTGRAFFAVRGSEMAAASLGIDVMRTKLAAFAVSGGLAGLAGTLAALEQGVIVQSQFVYTESLQLLAIAVVGGLTSLSGAVAAGILFAALNEIFFQYRALAGWLPTVSAGLLAVVLLAYPGGLAAAPAGFRRVLERFQPTSRLLDRGSDLVAVPFRAIGRSIWMGMRLLFTVAGTFRRGPHEDAPPQEPHSLDAAFDWMAVADARAATGIRGSGHPPSEPPRPKYVGLRPGDVKAGIGNPNGHRPETTATAIPGVGALDDRPRAERKPHIEAEDVTVRFGGLTAVDDASLRVYENEIVGLIGPNGAGKTTLFNAILGLNDPATGTVRIHGQDVKGKGPHERARLGVARTFQVVQLFSELNVSDNLLVATHMHNDSGLFSNIAASQRTLDAEVEARKRVDRIIELLHLEEVRGAQVTDLPFGLLRMVEMGRALVTGAPVLMLDEAASGLNDTETDRLVGVVRDVRDLGVSVLLIEHDIRMVTGVSDYMYCLDRGRMIAEGTPDQVKRHPEVVTAYLGASADDEATQEAEVDA